VEWSLWFLVKECSMGTPPFDHEIDLRHRMRRESGGFEKSPHVRENRGTQARQILLSCIIIPNAAGISSPAPRFLSEIHAKAIETAAGFIVYSIYQYTLPRPRKL
jgi:hypothetical protein